MYAATFLVELLLTSEISAQKEISVKFLVTMLHASRP